MSRDDRRGVLFLISLFLLALNLGCGGGGLPSATSSNPSVQTDSTTSRAIGAPTLGFVYVPGGSEVRVINGIPGASTQGSALALPAGVTGLDFAPGQEAAVAERSSGTSVGVISFTSGAAGTLVPISGAISQPEIIAFSPRGAAVALYSEAEGQLQVVSGLPSSPQLARSITVASLPASPRFLAIADNGETLLEGTAEGAVYLLASSGPQLLETVSGLGGMAFNPKSTDALIFDQGESALSLLPSVNSASPSRVLAKGLSGLEGTIALASDGRRAVITSTGAYQLWEVDLSSLQAQSLSLSTTPTMLRALIVSGDYLLAWQPGGLAWIIDTNQTKGAVYMVPAAAETQAALAR